MSSKIRLFLIIPLASLLFGCAMSGGGGPDSADFNPGPTKLKPDPEEVPAALKTIEQQIEKRSVLLADRIIIDVSRNYEWDVSLSGASVTKQEPVDSGAMQSRATGNPRAMIRNLELRAWSEIVFRKSGFGVTPYIKITATGDAVHAAVLEGGGIRELGRGPVVQIHNSDARYGREVLTRPAAASN